MNSYGTPEQKQALVAGAGWCVVGGIVVALSSLFLFPSVYFGLIRGMDYSVLPLFFAYHFIGLAGWVAGCGLLARSKGLATELGALGVLGIVGVLIVVALPDRWKRWLREREQRLSQPQGPSHLTNYPR